LALPLHRAGGGAGTRSKPPAPKRSLLSPTSRLFPAPTTAIDSAQERFGHIDILVNNVGGTIWAKPYAEYAEAQIEAEIRRSLFPTLWCCRAALPGMLARDAGVIVNVSSIATRGVSRVPYAAAKGGVNAITASL
jgi:dihydroxycyclohexadiene carboxylate dehydrogenase